MARRSLTIRLPQLAPDILRDDLGKSYRYGIAKLTHGFSPRAMEHKLITEGLSSSTIAHGEIPHVAARLTQHIFAARHAVHTGFQRLRRLIEWAPGMSRIRARARLEEMIVMQNRTVRLGFRVR